MARKGELSITLLTINICIASMENLAHPYLESTNSMIFNCIYNYLSMKLLLTY